MQSREIVISTLGFGPAGLFGSSPAATLGFTKAEASTASASLLLQNPRWTVH